MKQVIVDCEKNARILWLHFGGPMYLGYDFYVEDENVDKIVELIKDELRNNNQPLVDIRVIDTKEKTIWTEDMIKKEIKNGY